MTTTPDPEAERAGAELDVYRPGELRVPEARELVADLVNTEFVPKDLRGKPGAVLACILTGQELGVGAMTSLAKVHVIEGRPALSAELMRALILKAGHSIWLEESSATRVTLAGARKETPEHVTRITWTMDDAKKANVEGKTNWKRYPRAMLTARATGELARMVFPDVLAGISYTREEVLDGFELDEDAPPIEGGIPEGAPDGVAPPPAARPTRTAPDAGRSRAPAPDEEPAAPPLPDEDEDDVVDAVVVEDATEDAVEVIPVEEADVAPEATPEEEAPRERKVTPAQRLVIIANEAGLDDDQRHGLYRAVTAGRTSSGNDLTREEYDRAEELLGRIKAGEVALGHESHADGGEEWWVAPLDDPEEWLAYGAHEEPTPATAPEEEPLDVLPEDDDGPDLGTEDGWRAYIKAKGIRLPDVLRTAKALTAEGGQAPPSLSALAEDAELSAKVAEHFDRLGS